MNPSCDLFEGKKIMISNERSWPHLRRPNPDNRSRGQAPYDEHRPPVNEDTLKSVELQVERKFFQFTLKENARGRFLRITEDGGGRHNAIIIPLSGLEDFKRVLNEMLKASDETPANPGPAPEA
jgi:hypothetical protein